MLKSHREMVEMITKGNEKSLEESTKEIQASEKTITEMTKKFVKLHAEVTKFRFDFQSSADQNTEVANKVITSLGTNLSTNREALSRLRGELKADNSELNASIISKIEQLQKDLAAENAIMDKLATKNEKSKVLSIKLNYVNKHLDDLETKKASIRSCVSEINHYLQCLMETQHSMLIVSIRQHLSEKLTPEFGMLNRIEGVSEGDALLK